MNRLSDLSTRTWLVLIALGLLFARIVPVFLLDRTEVSKEKRAQDPFSRPVNISSTADRDSKDGTSTSSSDDTSTRLRIPAEHLASYLLANMTGGLKQVAITSLWVKYGRLKDEQRYDEAVALLQMLKVLQPEREQVWSYLNYDIAFTISRYQPNKKQEWKEVKKAAKIARDGNQRMGGSTQLRFDLSWIYGYRVPQDPYMMHQTWKERNKTNYRVALEHLKKGRLLAKKRNQLDQYLKYYVFMINYSFSDIVMLMYYGEHDLALKRISEYKKFGESLLEDYKIHNRMIPDPFKVRLDSFEDLPRIVKADRRLDSVPWEKRTQKIKRTKAFLTAWSQFFHNHRGALAEEASRHVIRRSFDVLYYATQDLERYYKTGKEQFRKRASTVLQNVLIPRIQGLMPEKARMGGGHVRKAHEDLGMFWEQINAYFKNLDALFSTEEAQKKEEIRRRIEEVYTELMNLYRSNHRGFNMEWFKKTIETLESDEVLNY